MTLRSVETLPRKQREEITAEICKNCIENVKQVENFSGKQIESLIEKWTNWKLNWMQMKMRVT